jgi:hypothetical protein
MSEHRDKSIFDLMDEMMDLSDSILDRKTERLQKPEIEKPKPTSKNKE